MIYTQIIRKQLLKSDIDLVWDFMSSPINLELITPKWMMFKIISDNPDEKIYPGMIISYKVSPILQIPMNWLTEITHVKNKKFFIDEQRLGPYKMWHHQHIFEIQNNDVLMKDIITYVPPFGIFGRIANVCFVKKRINDIFDYREKILNQVFNHINR